MMASALARSISLQAAAQGGLQSTLELKPFLSACKGYILIWSSAPAFLLVIGLTINSDFDQTENVLAHLPASPGAISLFLNFEWPPL